MASSRRAGIAVAAWLGSIGTPLAAQAVGSLGIGASFVEYDGFLSSSAAVFAPALRFDSRRLSLGGQGSWTVFESGSQVIQANAAAAWLTGTGERWRLELSGAAGASKYAAEPGSGHLLGGARIHLVGEHGGGWAGVTGGRFLGGTGVTPVELAVAGWSVRHRVTLVGTVTATWLGRDRHLDLLAVARWTGPHLELEARAGARPYVRSGGAAGDAITGGYGELTATVPVSHGLAVSLGAGRYPSDPVRRVLGASYLNAGIRVRAFGPAAPVVPLLATAMARGRPAAVAATEARLEIVGSGERRTIRVQAPGAQSVELMGDFTDWGPIALGQVAPGVWEARLPLPSGVHRVNVRLDGRPWSVPGGTRPERTEFGGVVGVLMVP